MRAIRCCGQAARNTLDGLSLIELLIALGVFGALLLIVPPAYSKWIAMQQLANEAYFLAETLQRARSEAIKHGYRVNVCKSSDRIRCSDSADWAAGWVMYVDENQDGEIDSDELVLDSKGRAAEGVSIQANRPIADFVSYTSLGHARLLNGALQMGTFVLCKSGQNALKVVLANSGRTHIDKTHEACP